MLMGDDPKVGVVMGEALVGVAISERATPVSFLTSARDDPWSRSCYKDNDT